MTRLFPSAPTRTRGLFTRGARRSSASWATCGARPGRCRTWPGWRSPAGGRRGREWLDRLGRHLPRDRRPGGLGWALGLLAFVRYHQGRLDEAETLGDQILAEAEQRGDKWAAAMMRVLVSLVRLWTGRTQSAVEYAEAAAATFREQHDWYGGVQAQGALGRIRIALGQLDDGFAALLEGLGVADGAPSARAAAIAPVQLAAGAAQAGEPGRLPAGADPMRAG